MNLCDRLNVADSSAIDGERISPAADRLAWTSVDLWGQCDGLSLWLFLWGTDEYSSFPLRALADTVRPMTLLEKHRAILVKGAGSVSPQI